MIFMSQLTTFMFSFYRADRTEHGFLKNFITLHAGRRAIPEEGFHHDDETSPGFLSSSSLCCAIWCGTGRQRSTKERPEQGDGGRGDPLDRWPQGRDSVWLWHRGTHRAWEET